MIKLIALLTFSIILILGLSFTNLNSKNNIAIRDQNKTIYDSSVIIVVIGVLLMVIPPAAAAGFTFLKRMPPGGEMINLVALLFLLGIILTTIGSIAVQTYNDSSISDENKSDNYIMLSSILTSVGVGSLSFLIGYIIRDQNIQLPNVGGSGYFGKDVSKLE